MGFTLPFPEAFPGSPTFRIQTVNVRERSAKSTPLWLEPKSVIFRAKSCQTKKLQSLK
jgi:hypothetical protein